MKTPITRMNRAKLTLLAAILYASVQLPASTGHTRLSSAVQSLLKGLSNEPTEPQILWELQYSHSFHKCANASADQIRYLAQLPPEFLFGDIVIEEVKQAWSAITGQTDTSLFMAFEQREVDADDDR